MTISTFGFALITMASVGACLGQDLASPAEPPPLGPLRIVAEESGVVPVGSSFVVQTDDAVTAVRGSPGRRPVLRDTPPLVATKAHGGPR
jgi:hypothetical protein